MKLRSIISQMECHMKAKGIAAILLLGMFALSSAACGGGTEAGKIAFVSERDGNKEIYVVNADGTGLTRLASDPSRDNDFPVWSPDGKMIAFESSKGMIGDIYVMNADGTEQTNLTNLEEWGWAVYPTWSPDGRKIAYHQGEQIWIMSLDNRLKTALTPEIQDIGLLKWSPDGEKIAFTVYGRRANDGLYVINVDGTGLKRLISGDNRHPMWLPDGDRITVACVVEGNSEIYVIEADGTGLARLTDDPSWDYTPSWSPDGTKIAFGSGREGCGEIFVMDADGSQQTNLTRTPDACSDYPRWSPDGKMIAFKSGRDGNSEIYVMNYDGSDQTNITNHPASEPWLAWSP